MALIGGHGRRRAKAAVTNSRAKPAVELPPPNLLSELLNLERRFGREAVIAEFERLTAPRRGRPPLDDLKLLDPQFERDARALLEGQDPQKVASNKAIAINLSAKLAEGRTEEEALESIERRLMRVLSKHRADRILGKVIATKGNGYPHAAYLTALRWRFSNRLLLSEPIQELAAILADQAEATISRFRERLGEPPDAMTLGEIEAALAAWVPPPVSLTDALNLDPTSPLGVLSRLAESSPET
jgi:hypothetical protein